MDGKTEAKKKRVVNPIQGIILTFCTIVTTCVLYVLLVMFDSQKSRPGAIGSACMDIVCMVILFILVSSFIFGKGRLGRTTNLFLALMLGTKWALFFDFLTWGLDGVLVYDGWTFLFTVASLCSGSILGAIFVLYLGSYLIDIHNLTSVRIRSRVCFVINVISFVLTVTLGLTKSAFYFVGGHYTTGALYDVITVLPILTLLYMMAFCIRNVKIIGSHDVVAVIVYMLIMMIGAIVEAMIGVGTTYVCISIADVFIFVMLQNRMIDREIKQNTILEEKVEKWRAKSITDEITGINNRRAYEDEMARLEEETSDAPMVYLSMDVNGLKVVNDTLGHEAGDELLVGACDCMKNCLGPFGKLYRIGGDEFVALIYAEPHIMNKLMKDFDEEVANWRGSKIETLTISYGYVSTSESEGKSLRDMAVLADERMYESKRRFYQKKGVDRRGQRGARAALCDLYTKILTINITEDSFEIVSMNEEEHTSQRGYRDELSEWMKEFANSGGVHRDDLEEYLEKTSLDYIGEYFNTGSDTLKIFYRRRYADEFRKVMMEIIRTNEYSDDNQKLYLYVKDIS